MGSPLLAVGRSSRRTKYNLGSFPGEQPDGGGGQVAATGSGKGLGPKGHGLHIQYLVPPSIRLLVLLWIIIVVITSITVMVVLDYSNTSSDMMRILIWMIMVTTVILYSICVYFYCYYYY